MYHLPYFDFLPIVLHGKLRKPKLNWRWGTKNRLLEIATENYKINYGLGDGVTQIIGEGINTWLPFDSIPPHIDDILRAVIVAANNRAWEINDLRAEGFADVE